ncbi:hypothetical protein CGCFRS4_v015772 [Colletotrichum fructicola]|nr:hypothetical protein CGCFRS4_v015772 [Colletotrichum fructicola]
MAGQHRLCALRQYIKATGAPESDAWWTCDLYDKDQLPADLNIKLRVNSRDPSLPDNHGQIWNHLVSIASVAAGSITGSRVTVDHRLVEALRLGSEKSFPTRRLVTLWNHIGWREITTRWCQTRLGLETFNISTFEWMAGLRIDDYWFATMRTVLATLEALPLDETQDLGLDDWSRLASGLQGGKETSGTAAGRTSTTQDVVEAIFFTGNGDRRVAGLLETLDDAMYRAVCRAVWNGTDLHFAYLKRLLRNRRPETEAAVRALQHVIGWVDRASAVELESVNPKLKNKPQLLEHLQDALDSLSSSRGDSSGFPANTARRLQQQVLDFARCNAKVFRTPEAQSLLASPITHVDDPTYGKRFEDASRARLLRVVRRTVDPQDGTHILRPAWETVNANEGCLREAQVSTLVSAFCSDLIRLSDQPIRKKDTVLLALQRRIEKVLAASASELQGIVLASVVSSNKPVQHRPANSDDENDRGDDDDDDDDNDDDDSCGLRRPESTSRDLNPPPSAQRRRPARDGSTREARGIVSSSPETSPPEDNQSWSKGSPRQQAGGRQRQATAATPTAGPPKTS